MVIYQKIIQTQNKKQKNRKYLTDCSKHESRPRAHISTNNNNNNGDNCEEVWDDNEFMGMQKKTFDPAKGAGKNKYRTNINNLIKNNFILPELFSQKTFIKIMPINNSCRKERKREKKNKSRFIYYRKKYQRNFRFLSFLYFGRTWKKWALC